MQYLQGKIVTVSNVCVSTSLTCQMHHACAHKIMQISRRTKPTASNTPPIIAKALKI